MKKTIGHKNKSFTLVELLIVVGIVGILAGLIVAAINPNLLRQKARDANRKKDISVLSEAVGQYYADNNAYPAALTDLVPEYLTSVPSAGTQVVAYCYSSPGQTYNLCTQLENTSEASTGTTCFAPAITPYYCVSNPF